MPQTTLLASSCAITLPPAATMSAAPCSAVRSHAGEDQRQAGRSPDRRRRGKQRVHRRLAEIDEVAVVERDPGCRAARAPPACDGRRERRRRARHYTGSPCCASRTARLLARARCSAKIVVNVGGMCCVMRTGARSIDRAEPADHGVQRLRPAGRRADHQRARQRGARTAAACGPADSSEPGRFRDEARARVAQPADDAGRSGPGRLPANRTEGAGGNRARGSFRSARGGT